MLELTMSPQVDAIAGSLAKAQSTFPVLKKESKAEIRSVKGNREYHYAGLGAVLDAIRGPLAANGIAYSQPLEETDLGTFLITLLIHTSGQWLCSRLRIPNDLIGAQAVGSYIAYARRYSIASLTGVAVEDDDGRVAQRQAERQQPQRAPEPRASWQDKMNPPGTGGREPGSDDDRPVQTVANDRVPRTVGKVRTGTWLYHAAEKQGLLDEFVNLGNKLGYPLRIIDWSPAQVAGAIQIRKERLAQ